MSGNPSARWAYHRSRDLSFDSGTAIIYSDAHYWPGSDPTMSFRALLVLADALRPTTIIANGDLIDGARVSRHGRIGWARAPEVVEEIGECQLRQDEIRRAAPKAKRFRTVGNHDLRYDNWLSAHAGDFEGLPGFRMSDFLPDWQESWSVRVNGAVVKHRLRGGEYAAANNVKAAGCSVITGHLHRCAAYPIRGYSADIKWGVETGTLAVQPAELPDEGDGPFEYLEDGPTNWSSGFAVLTWHKGVLLRPEFCEVQNGVAYFRGQRVACPATRSR
jgi:hypothetical protein